MAPLLKLNQLLGSTSGAGTTERLPVLFVGHGNPMNAIEDNIFSRGMKQVAQKLPRPRAIVVVSAHWETAGTFVTSQEKPKTIHDFGGFPKALFDVQYPAPGDPELARSIQSPTISLSDAWGLDHGCWSVLRNMFPDADIPVVQISLDYRKNGLEHLEIARSLRALRTQGALIIGSGNIVHNFSEAAMRPGADFNTPFAHDWAIEANERLKSLISNNDNRSLAEYYKLGSAIRLAVPTPEHYLPLLYATALRDNDESVSFFNDATVAGSFSMTSLLIGS